MCAGPPPALEGLQQRPRTLPACSTADEGFLAQQGKQEWQELVTACCQQKRKEERRCRPGMAALIQGRMHAAVTSMLKSACTLRAACLLGPLQRCIPGMAAHMFMEQYTLP
eukprot:1159737-Pelagomonas_calceolata.AAC.6